MMCVCVIIIDYYAIDFIDMIYIDIPYTITMMWWYTIADTLYDWLL